MPEQPPPRAPASALPALLALQLASQLLYFMTSSQGFARSEELHTPAAALMMLNGFAGEWLSFQYMTFCGGCTIHAAMVAPLYAVAGPSLLAWKIVAPWSASAMILAAGYQVALRYGGPRAALLFGLWMVLAPTYYLHCAMVGYSNHVEVMAGVLVGLYAWDRALETDGWGWPLAVGLIWGTSFWFGYTSAFAPPVLALLWAAWRPRDLLSRRLPAALAGLAAGLAPWAWSQLHSPAKGGRGEEFVAVYQAGVGSLISLENVAARLAHLGPPYWRSLYAPALGGDQSTPGLIVAALQAVGIVAALLLAAVALRRRSARPLDLAIPALICTFLALYLLVRPPGVAGDGPAPLQHPEDMRYLAPTVSLTGLCMARAMAAAWCGVGEARWGAALAPAAALLLLGAGLTARLAEIKPRTWTPRALYLHAMEWGSLRNRIPSPDPNVLEDAGDDIQGWLGDRHPIAARPMLMNLGGRLAHRALYEDALAPRRRAAGQAARWLGALEGTDRRALLQGLAETWRSWEAHKGDEHPRRAQALLDELGPALACALRRERARIDHVPHDDRVGAWAGAPERRLPEPEGECPGEHDWMHGRAAMSWGVQTLDFDLRAPLDAMALVQRGASELPAARLEPFMEGAGERAGELWGHDPSAREALAGAAPSAWRGAFDRGFSTGAVWVYWWPRALDASEDLTATRP